MEFWLSAVFVIGLMVIHLLAKNMKFLSVEPRSRFLSVAGGISVAYVFLHLLPELGEFQEHLRGTIENEFWQFFEDHIYLVAMLGLALFYGLEQMVKKSKRQNDEADKRKATAEVFWIHISSFALYNGLIGYLLIREEFADGWGKTFFFIAMGVHFITNDRGLRATHKEDYDKFGRWLLTAAVFIGWLIGVFTEVSELLISFLVAFLAGSVILNVMKEELPDERASSFSAFFMGLTAYSFLLFLF
ncbi:ZIP family transporter [Planococcus lenghuensis]|uniref:ZIP Zinc transporter n=1 Tax=Planococcus lenghuensis TaxID=2213202 RepID=A0A1Q2KWJ3_9BACL|nr:hypothetical protein [Planococcus lenghuensis]AQQ52042.1 hypothetical protein B0X71_02160 [Planococcus lenghuensis]